MIEEPPKLTINAARRRPTDAQIKAFAGVPSSMVSDAMFGKGALGKEICPLFPGTSAAGPALTADSGPGDILPLLATLPFIRPGDVVISAVQAYQGCAAAGDRVAGMMKNAGAVGLVTDGPLRDADGIEAVGMPVWCTGLTPASPVTTGPGRVGFSIRIAGQRVASGDMIIADRDGVVVVPFEDIDRVLSQVETVRSLEEALDADVRDGLVCPPSITELLASDDTIYEG